MEYPYQLELEQLVVFIGPKVLVIKNSDGSYGAHISKIHIPDYGQIVKIYRFSSDYTHVQFYGFDYSFPQDLMIPFKLWSSLHQYKYMISEPETNKLNIQNNEDIFYNALKLLEPSLS